jgi:hypothetical protein
MKNKTQIVLSIVLVFVLLLPFSALAQTQSGFRLVTCGNQKNAQGQVTNPCTFNDLMLILVRLINLLFAAAGIVAIYYIMMAAWEMVIGLGRPEKITKGKDALFHAVIGFAIILLSFAFINLLLGLFNINCSWWSPSVWQNTQGFYDACIRSFSP